MPYKDEERKREYQRQYYREHSEGKKKCEKESRETLKQKGLCIDCGKPAVLREIRCAWCNYKHKLSCQAYHNRNREYLVERNRECRERWLAEGRCRGCGTPLIEGEIKYCMNCSMHLYRQYPGGGRRHEVNYETVARQS